MKVVSFATEGAYAAHGDRLRASCEKFGLDFNIVVYRRDFLPDWQQAVLWKPKFILEQVRIWDEYDGLLWTDADSVFLRDPDFSVFENGDVGWHWFKRSVNHAREPLTGTMFFRPQQPVVDFIRVWSVSSELFRGKFTPEQDGLQLAWNRNVGLRHVDPGPEWCWIFDDFLALYGYRISVVEHYQASRENRHESPGSTEPKR